MNEWKTGIRHIFYIFSHPFDGFWIMKSEKKGNLKTAFLILALLVVTTILRVVSTGYLFTSAAASGFSAWMLGLGILLIVFLYCTANWALTTLLNGNGSFGYIFMSMMYAVTPLVILNIPIMLFSNLLVLEEAAFLNFFNAVCILWTLFLLLVANSAIHEYTMLKSVATFIGTLIIMLAIAVLAILFFNLIQQVYVWIASIVKEISFRL